jgi:hypothetical protein
MSKRITAVTVLMLLILACGGERAEPLSDQESAEVQAKAFNFQVYPGAQFADAQTDLLRRAHFVMQPDAVDAPPLAVYETDAPLEDVAKFYAEKYGYTLAENEANSFKTTKASAHYLTGDIGADTQAIAPVIEKLGTGTDVSKASGTYRGAYFEAQETLPRVNLQRPYFDISKSEVVDRTLIVMVREK